MSIDKLQDKIRKMKNPSMIMFSVIKDHIPPHILQEQGSVIKAYGKYCLSLMEGLKDVVPAVRFRFSSFALYGEEGISLFSFLLNRARDFGYYVVVDAVEALSRRDAQTAAEIMMEYPCDGIVISAYIGSDAVKPYAEKLKDSKKSLFVVIRTANKSAPELQDLITGSRLVHMATADSVSRIGENCMGRRGYSLVAGVAAATFSDPLRLLRAKYKNLFLLVDGYDYSNANAKNCSFAFDNLGHGAVVCACDGVCAAWKENTEGQDFILLAQEAAYRMKKNITRYITVL